MKKINVLFISQLENLLNNYKATFGSEYNVYINSNLDRLNDTDFENPIDVVILDFKDNYKPFINKLLNLKPFFTNKALIIIVGYNCYENVFKSLHSLNIFRFILRPLDYKDLKLTIEKAYENINLTREKEKLIKALKKSNYILEEQKKLVVNDFIKLKNLQNEIIEKEKLSTIGLLTSSIIHDIKNSLNIISGYTELIQIQNPNFSKYTSKILQEVNNLIISLQDILDFSKENKNINYKMDIFEKQNLYSEISNLIESFKIRYKFINFNLIDKTNTNFKIKLDFNRIRRVLINIIKNATEAVINSKQPEIEIVLNIANNKQKQYLVISVIDNGIGISKNELKNIFQPFYTRNKKNGTGLGLTISKNIIENHNGFIQLSSEKEKGTEFKIFLPLI